MAGNYQKDIFKQLMEIMERCDSLEKELKSTKASSKSQISSLHNRCDTLEQKNTELLEKVDVLTIENAFLKKENELLKSENAHLKSIIGSNSDNSSQPPSSDQKPSKKKANEYNGRNPQGKSCGGQKGHKGACLSKEAVQKKIRTGELEHRIEHWADGAQIYENIPKTRYVSHYVVDFEIRTVAKELRFYADKNGCYHVPKQYRGEVTYGDTVKSLAVTLYSEGNMSLERIQELLCSLSNRTFTISQGSIFSFLKNFLKSGTPSLEQIELELLSEKTLYTDATCTSTNGVLSYIRNFTGSDAVRYYPMAKKSIPELNRIELLKAYRGTLVHDHETALYHFGTEHGECNVHLLRYLRKNTEETQNDWSSRMIHVLSDANKRRKELLEKKEFFSEKEVTEITRKYEGLLAEGYAQNKKTQHKYAREDELTLLNRLKKYQRNHLLFLTDENVKFHNNDSECDLRKCKVHQKMSGGFRTEQGSQMYCDIMSIIETCKKKHMEIFKTICSIFNGKRAVY